MVEQQGDRLHHMVLPEYTGKKYAPSAFSLMLIHCGDEDGTGAELIVSQFDSHFKLSMMVHGRMLHEGSYLIMVAPEWNKQA